MTRGIVFALLALGLVSERRPAASSAQPDWASNVQRHHYAINARVRPLWLFWISRHDIGDAVVVRRQAPSEVGYSLLIGSDPERAPRRINRWGYLDEQIKGDDASLIGLMTESDEESIEEAEASIKKQAGYRTFKIIRASVNADQSRSVVTSVEAPATYSFRELQTLLTLAQRDAPAGRARMIALPAGTRPGFLVAIAELLHRQAEEWRSSGRVRPGGPISYVYHGRIYQLAVTRTQPLATVRLGGRSYANVISSDFEIRNAVDGEVTPFSMTFGTDGSLAETPLLASYQPRWWLQIDLALDDATSGPPLAGESYP
jgi:hypothetical protein